MNENPDNPLELYNLELDPGEENDVSGDYPEIAKEMRGILKQAHIPSVDFPMPGE
jgi:hypothetical protein